MVVRVKCETEWNSIINLLLRRSLYCLPINLMGAMMAHLNNRDRIPTFVEKKSRISFEIKEKSESSLDTTKSKN